MMRDCRSLRLGPVAGGIGPDLTLLEGNLVASGRYSTVAMAML